MLPSLLAGLMLQCAAAPQVAADQVEQRPYRAYVRECLDVLVRDGTDRYGAVKAPILVAILEVHTRTCPEKPLALDQAWRAVRPDRRAPAGSDLYWDQATLRAMLELNRLSGEPKYAQFARQYVEYATTKLVDDKGLFWWGWHRHYDVFREQMVGHNGNPHEIHVQEPTWHVLFSISPDAVHREIEALWQWHVIDKTTGEINRHGDGHRGCDFAMSAGEILEAFAFMYRQTGREQWLDRARRVAAYHHRARNPQTSLIPNRPNAGKDRFDGSHFDTSIIGLYCRGLWRASAWTDDPQFRRQAVGYLKAYARYGYDAQAGTFWGSLNLDGTPVAGPRQPGGYAQYEPRGHIDVWQPYAAGYEHALATAQMYALAAQDTGDAELRTAAQRWANVLHRVWPPRSCDAQGWYAGYARDWAPAGTYAEHYGRTISFLLAMHRLTGQPEHLELAKTAAREAVSKLYFNGLLRGHPNKPYYEAHDGVGYLLVALLQLDQNLAGRRDVVLDNF
jgi:hypothetical protein